MKEINTLIIFSNQDLLAKTGAAYSRILCYAKAIASKKATNVMLSSHRLPNNMDNQEIVYSNIWIIGQAKPQSNSKILKNLSKIFLPFVTIRFLHQFHRNYKDHDFTWFVFPIKFISDLFLVLYVKFIRAEKIYCEKNELKAGMVLNNSMNYTSIGGLLFTLLFPALYLNAFLNDRLLFVYDGVAAISKNIEIFAKKYNRNVIRVPIITDVHLLQPQKRQSQQNDPFSICFAGGISIKKEGLDVLLTALNILMMKGGSFILNIYGGGDRNSEWSIRSQIDSYGLREYVNLNGVVSSDELNSALPKHDLLIMTRPSNTQTEYGLSTKLAEYMASGTAVMVTDVSDNRLFIQDGVNGFIVEPGNIDDIVNKLMKILNNEYDLKSIGERGRETALKYFDYKNYAEILNKFLFG